LPDPDRGGARGHLLVRFDIEAPRNQIVRHIIATAETSGVNVIDTID